MPLCTGLERDQSYLVCYYEKIEYGFLFEKKYFNLTCYYYLVYMSASIMDQQESGSAPKKIRILVSKLGLDGHDRGALIICRALRDAGMEVIYSGLFCTPEQVVKTAIEEDVDVVAMSLLNGAHLTIFPKVSRLFKEKNIDDILLVGGGVIPESDKKLLEDEGITGNFGPGTPLQVIIEHIQNNIKKNSPNNIF